jgi:hypoxanthine phosphoribosyltransferase
MTETFKCRMYSWDEMYQLAEKTIAKINKSGYKPDKIIGITRGGWVPSMMFSDLLGNRDLLSLKIEHWSHTATKDAKAVLKYPLQADLSNQKILLVDDLTDSGDSIILALEDVRKNNPKEVRTATLIHKKQSKIKPDYFAEEKNKWEWIILPWNLNEDLLNLSKKIIKEEGKLKNTEIRKKLKQKYNLTIDQKTLDRVLARKNKIWT